MGACDAGKIEELNQAIKTALDVHREINLDALNATSRNCVGEIKPPIPLNGWNVLNDWNGLIPLMNEAERSNPSIGLRPLTSDLISDICFFGA